MTSWNFRLSIRGNVDYVIPYNIASLRRCIFYHSRYHERSFSNALTHPRVFSIKASLSTTMERIFTVWKCKESPGAILRIALGVTLRKPRRSDRTKYSDVRNEVVSPCNKARLLTNAAFSSYI